MLNKDGIEAAIAAQISDEEDDDLSDEAKAAVLREALRPHPAAESQLLRLHGHAEIQDEGPCSTNPARPARQPFHEYTMRQAIEEGFIMDVLQNYTTYKRFYGLIKQIEDDPDVPRREAAKVLTRYLELHPVNIEQVVSVIVRAFSGST